jgi:hypothetical protein
MEKYSKINEAKNVQTNSSSENKTKLIKKSFHFNILENDDETNNLSSHSSNDSNINKNTIDKQNQIEEIDLKKDFKFSKTIFIQTSSPNFQSNLTLHKSQSEISPTINQSSKTENIKIQSIFSSSLNKLTNESNI